jgi:uncharacterized damage-inducible protein DinB
MRSVRQNQVLLSISLLTALFLMTPAMVQAEDIESHEGMKGEMLISFNDAQSKLLELAEATPEDKYSWRPAEGVRSQGEVFLHVAAANFGLPNFWGVAPPEGFAFQGYEQSMTSKEDIKKAMEDSFTHMEKAFLGLSDDEMSKEVDLFGNKITVLGGYMILVGHVHEHLGQSIAYARSNGIVPPWSARQQEAQEEGGE